MRSLFFSAVMTASVALAAPPIEFVPSGCNIQETTSGDKLAYVQIITDPDSDPNLNPRFDVWGRVPKSIADSVRKALLAEASKTPDFPSVLIARFDATEEHRTDTLVLGKLLDERVSHVLLAHAASLGIKRIIFSQVHHTFVIGRHKSEDGWHKDITNSIKEYFPSYNPPPKAKP